MSDALLIIIPWLFSACQIYSAFRMWPLRLGLPFRRHAYVVAGVSHVAMLWWIINAAMYGLPTYAAWGFLPWTLCFIVFNVLLWRRAGRADQGNQAVAGGAGG